MRAGWLVAGLLAATLPDAQAAEACVPDPLAGRALYLRGSFNAWTAPDAQRFTYDCRRWTLVTRIQGEHSFKIGDEGWSPDADYGSPDGTRLVARGPDLKRRFNGATRIAVTLSEGGPLLTVQDCPVQTPPLGDTTLFLRGTPNNWAAVDDAAFQFSCDAYYLNVKLSGRHEFKIADASWKPASTIGAGGLGGGNLVETFSGEHTLRLAWVDGQPQLSVGPRSFADPRAAAVTDPVALSLRFDSRDAAFKRPFGAVPAGTTVQYAVEAAPGVDRLTLVVERRRLEGNQEVLAYDELARLPMQREGTRWRAAYRFADMAVYGVWFEAEIAGRRFALQNNAEPLFWTREKGTGGRATVAAMPASAREIRRFRQTVHDPAFTVPAWVADAVYYQIFPERFRNGDRANDPKPGVARYHDKTVELHPRWNERPYRPGDGSDPHFNNDFFGGDLPGITQKLATLRELGANTLYLTPIFLAASNHKYDTADYRQVDPAFGGNAAFTRLVREAKRHGIRVLPDASFNHTGQDSVYFNRFGNFGADGAFQNGRINPASPYASWYRFDPSQSQPDKQYQGWVGVADLPELDKTSRGVRDFFYGEDGITQRWLATGTAGWRMDVAPWVPDDFWREWRTAVKRANPQAVTVAETWFDASKHLLGDMFDSTMNYIFRNTVLDIAAGGDVASLYRHLEHVREAYPPPALHAAMNLISSHDQPRALHVLGGHEGEVDPAVMARAKARLRLATFFQMTYPGAPSVYYGDEVGVTGGDDPFNRAPYPWADLGGQPDTALRADFRRLIQLRRQHAVLRRGELLAPLHADGRVLVLARRLGRDWALVAINNGEAPQRVTVTLPVGAPTGPWRDALQPGAPLQTSGRSVTLELPPVAGRAWFPRR